MKNRVKEQIVQIDYNSTYDFFKKRSEKFNPDNPYIVTMYQDNNPELAFNRDILEKEVITPQLQLTEFCSALDIGCGIGRWADIIKDKVDKYLGTDFSLELLEIAKQRVGTVSGRLMFQQIAAQDILKVKDLLIQPPFNRFIVAGVLVYLNDEDVIKCFESILSLSNCNSIIYIREPVGIDKRLTLDQFYSNELSDNYSAVYRTRQEYYDIFNKTFLREGFYIKKEGVLFEDKLTNRKETTQCYFILERKTENE